MPRRQQEVLFLAFSLTLTAYPVYPKSSNSEIAEILHRPIRGLTFPDSSTTGIFAALAVPLEDPYKSISIAYFFEATYGLPSNSSNGPWTEGLKREAKRSLDRTTFYQVLENKFDSSGYKGRECLLRAICETAEISLRHNGLIGDLMHIIFTNRSKLHTIAMCYFAWLTRVSGVKNITYGVGRHIGSIGFPEGSGAGLFFALGVPVDVPNKAVLLSLYFEANYGLPGELNSTYYEDESFFKKRSLDRRLAYDILTNKLDSFGYSGKTCLLRMICEVANRPLTGNGVLGDVLQIFFTPSSSRDENLPNKITEAEYAEDCSERYKRCPESPLDLISNYVPGDNS